MDHIERILNSALFAMPEGLDRKWAKQATILIGLGVLAGAMHGIEGLLYASRNLSLLVWLNLASVLCYVLFVFLIRRDHINWAVTVAWLELSRQELAHHHLQPQPDDRSRGYDRGRGLFLVGGRAGGGRAEPGAATL
jgi:hypothetical protein